MAARLVVAGLVPRVKPVLVAVVVVGAELNVRVVEAGADVTGRANKPTLGIVAALFPSPTVVAAGVADKLNCRVVGIAAGNVVTGAANETHNVIIGQISTKAVHLIDNFEVSFPCWANTCCRCGRCRWRGKFLRAESNRHVLE